MRAIFLIFLLVAMIDRAKMAFNPFAWFVTTTPSSIINQCDVNNRIWGLCQGNPLKRTTIDGCALKTEICDTGSAVVSAFVDSLVLPPTNRPVACSDCEAPKCTDGSHLSQGSYGSCKSKHRTTRSIRNPKRDIMILLDQSGSVGSLRFEKVKDIASGIAKLLCGDQRILPSRTRLGVISFDSEVHPHISLKDDNEGLNDNIRSIVEKIKTIKYSTSSGKSTCLVKALEYIDQNSFSPLKGGRRNDPDVVQEIIIVTDGCANCNGNLAAIRNNLVNKGTDIYVVGIGIKSGSACQRNLRTLAFGGKCYQYFFIDSWGPALNDFVDYLVNVPFHPTTCLSQLYSDDRSCAL